MRLVLLSLGTRIALNMETAALGALDFIPPLLLELSIIKVKKITSVIPQTLG